MKKNFKNLPAILILIGSSLAFTSCNNVSKRPFVIIGPMECEYKYLANCLTDVTITKQNNFTFYSGNLDGYPAVVINSLVGMVNGTSAATLAITKYNPELVIMQGTAGGHNPTLHQGDIVIGERHVEIGSYYSPHKNEGDGIDVSSYIRPGVEMKDENEDVIREKYIYSDSEAVTIAKSVNYKYGSVIKGTIGTGDVWNKEIDLINYLHTNLGTDCEEMEGFAVAQTCKNLNTKCITIRCISNSELYLDEVFDTKYGVYAQEFTRSFITSYRNSKNL